MEGQEAKRVRGAAESGEWEGETERGEAKAASEKVSMELLGHRVDRLEKKIDDLVVEYKQLDIIAKELIQRFQPYCQNLASEAGEDEMWSSLLEDRFLPVEVNLFFSYIVDALRRLHSCVLEKLPESASELPTLTSILKQKALNPTLEAVWVNVLQDQGLTENDVKLLCSFFVTYCHEAHYYPAIERENYVQNVQELIKKIVHSRVLNKVLLHVVQQTEKKKTVKLVDKKVLARKKFKATKSK
ncbi:single-pass membrane and coiled-coil domain-containing protein 1 [Callorhinchus milii]|uniref:Single-pass membrane protein with coiled-coil domains 1 n=1 Tax=Callorhinchus milii TaxID=7868 RepID=V9KQD6_CALMI|nr:single-pass membrane and coiled-coil domain-containing protein 1 [Callorhinchus milii]|eukprot:gi/632934460/ref/XP_007884258.1/ PREDICTED: single-pass membrane and coiled-coil domain-containing protein 1 [Callorhinchus milii]